MEKWRMIAILFFIGLVSAISGILQNIAADFIPDSWRPYLWISWPLFLIFTIVGIFLTVVQLRLGETKQDSDPRNKSTNIELDGVHAELHAVRREMELQARNYPYVIAKPQQALTNTLNWSELTLIAHKISQGSMSRVTNRYASELYQPREDLEKQFQAFLESEYVCFVLVGKSGAGKSNFLLSLDDPKQVSFPEICPILFDGAALNPYIPIITILTQGFEQNLAIDHTIDVCKEIQKIGGIEDHAVVLCIDAINENPNPAHLLKQIDDFVRTSHWPWLKVVITSRPEAWRLIKSNVLLGESRYYQPLDTQTLGGTDYFTVSAELELFTEDELRAAYGQYKQVYELETDFDDLDINVKLALQDPLILRLEAQMHQRGKIPPNINMHDVIRDYITYLSMGDSTTRRLENKDIRFLQEELMPLLIQDGIYENALTADKLKSTDRHFSRRLSSFESQIFGDRVVGNKEVNHSFMNLVDTQILTHTGRGEDFRVMFAYERYWDYFGGIRILELARSSGSPAKTYTSMIETIRKHPYMWGALLASLYLVLEENELSIIYSLAEIDNQDTHDLVVTALNEHANEDYDLVKRILDDLEPDWNKRFLSTKEVNRALVAIELAEHRNNEQVLERALGANVARLQDQAVIAIYKYWCKDQEQGFQLIRRITSEISVRSLIFNRGFVFSAISLTALIFFRHFQDYPGSNQVVINIWKLVIMRVLFFKPHSRRAERIFSYVRNQVLGLVAFIIDRFLASVPNRYLVINLAELKKYYRLPQQVKDTSTSLIPYLDIGHHDRNVFINTLDNLFCMKVNGSEVNNMLLKLLVDYCLVAWGLSKVDEAIDITQEFAERELDRPEPVKRVMWDKSWVYAALAMLCPNQFHSNHLSIYTQYMRRCFKEVNQWRGEVANYAYLGYSDYVYTSVRVDQYAGAPLIRELLEWGFIRNEYQKILDILEEMGYLAGSKYWKVMLNSIEPVLELCQVIPNTFSGGSEIEKVKNKLIDILSAVYIRHPYDVELYLHKHDLPEAIQKQTRIRKAEERVAGDLLKGGLGAWGKFGLTQGFSNRGRPIMMWAFRSALTAKSLDQFISQASKGVVNLVTDQQVFPLDEDLTHLILNLHAS